MKGLTPLLGCQCLPEMLFHRKMFKPAVKGLETGKTHIFRTAIGKGDGVAQSGTPDLIIIA